MIPDIQPLPRNLAQMPLARIIRSGTQALRIPEQTIRHVRASMRLRRSISCAERDGRLIALTYCHPKVGSTSIHHAIEADGRSMSLHVHALQEIHLRWRATQAEVAPDGVVRFSTALGRGARKHALAKAPNLPVATAIRDPLDVNLSLFVHWSARRGRAAHWRRIQSMATDDLVQRFKRDVPHQSILRWFFLDFAPSMNIDPDAVAFDRGVGACTVTTPRARVALMRADSSDALRAAVMTELLRRPVPTLGRHNASDKPEEREVMRRLRTALAADEGYLRSMASSEYVRCFWDSDGVERMWARWLQR